MSSPPPIDVTAILQVVQFLTSVVVAPGAIMLIRRLSAIRDHLARINGSVAELKQWREDHEQLTDRERAHHEETRRQCRETLGVHIKHIEGNLEQVWGRIGDRRRDPRTPTD